MLRTKEKKKRDERNNKDKKRIKSGIERKKEESGRKQEI